MYFREGSENLKPIIVPKTTKWVLGISVAVLVVFGIYPTPITDVAIAISKIFMP